MSKYDISILLPAIRTNLWQRYLDSLKIATNTIKYEVIFVGPYEPDKSILSNDFVKYIKDWGNCNRATQIALNHAEGEYILCASDDGYFVQDGLTHLFETMDSMGSRNPLKIAMGKYIEGDGGGWMDKDSYYKLRSHGDCPKSVPESYYMGNYWLLNREFLISEYGGFNMVFEGSALANNELAVRIQKFSQPQILLTDKQIVTCEHMPGTTGDHAPMHYAQILHDTPIYQQLIDTLCDDDKKQNIHNWIREPAIWERRFGRLEMSYKYTLIEKYGKQIYECTYF